MHKNFLVAAIVAIGLSGIHAAYADDLDSCEGVTTAAGITLPDPTFNTGGGHNFQAGQKLEYLESGWINPDHTPAAYTSMKNELNYPVADVKLTNCHVDLGGGVPSLKPDHVSVPVAPPPSTPTQAEIQAANDAASSAGSCVGMTTKSGLTQEGTGFNAGYIIDEMSVGEANPDGTVAWFNEAGGDVYPGQDVKIINCHITTDDAGNTSLAFDNTDAGQQAQIKENTEEELENLGVDDADAGNIADYAYAHPQSTCAKDVSVILDSAQVLNDAANIPADQRDDQWQSVNAGAQQQLSNAVNQAPGDCK